MEGQREEERKKEVELSQGEGQRILGKDKYIILLFFVVK